MPGVVIIEDQRIVREYVAQVLRLAGLRILGEAADGRSGWELIRQALPEVVVLDLNLPEISGFEVADRILTHFPSMRVLALSSRNDDHALCQVKRLHFHGFIDKQERGAEDIQTAIQAVLTGRTYYSPVLLQFWERHHRDQLNFERILSRKETLLLPYFGEGLSDEEIGQRVEMSATAVQKHRSNLLQKLALRGTPDLIRFAHLKGFTLPPEKGGTAWA